MITVEYTIGDERHILCSNHVVIMGEGVTSLGYREADRIQAYDSYWKILKNIFGGDIRIDGIEYKLR